MPKIRETFHSFFNKINNICIASGLNKRILQEDGLEKLSKEELKKKASQLVEALSRIEENARSLDKEIREFYETVPKE